MKVQYKRKNVCAHKCTHWQERAVEGGATEGRVDVKGREGGQERGKKEKGREREKSESLGRN